MIRVVAISFTVLIFVAAFNPHVQAQEPSEVRKTVIVATLSEAALASAALIQDASDRTLKELIFSGSYSEREWVVEAKGGLDDRSVGMTMTGFVWGNEETDLSVNYSGLGRFGEEPMRIHGETAWLYNADISDYQHMEIRHVMKFGNNSIWGWVVGSEAIFGGAVAAGAAIVASPVTGGGSLLIGAAAAIGGAKSTVLLSKNIRETIKSDEPTPPPEVPGRIEPPEPEQELQLDDVSEDTILIAVSRDGTIIGKGPSAQLLLSGEYDHEEGTYRVTIAPE